MLLTAPRQPIVQAKLEIGQPNDKYEQEADQVAKQIMRMPDSLAQKENGQPHKGINIQRISTSENDTLESAQDIKINPSGGRPLSSSTLEFMEPRFGLDFGHVRLHADQTANQTASKIQAKAFTYGHHVWLGKGESEQNKKLMAHELTHVVQQTSAVQKKDKTDITNNWISCSRIQRDVTPQCPGGEKTVTVDMVSLNGSTRNSVNDLDFANSVFRPCCVQFQLGRGMSVISNFSDIWLDGDTVLSRSSACGAVHAEETAMYDGAANLLNLSNYIRIFYVESISPTARAYCKPPYCATGDEASQEGMVAVTNRAADRSLAHEFGHILLNSGRHTGIDNPADTSNLMVPTNTATGETLDATQCATIFNNA